MRVSLRHLRLLLKLAEAGSVSGAAALCHVSQPAATGGLARLEAAFEARLFDRGPQGLRLTEAGEIAVARVARSFDLLDPALAALAPRLPQRVTLAQLTALIAVVEGESLSAAARRLGLAQPSVQRAIGQLEREVGHPLFQRLPSGLVPSRGVAALAIAAQLALTELAQAQADLGDLARREVGRVVIGAMPLSRSVLLGPAIARFRLRWPTLPVRVIDGPFADLRLGLRRGEVDFIVGALRPPEDGLQQDEILRDRMALVARPGHTALQGGVSLAELARGPWVVAPEGTPARAQFAAMFREAGLPEPQSLVETGALDLISDLVGQSDQVGFVSATQVGREVAAGRLAVLPLRPPGPARPIGLIARRDWRPTRAQSEMMAALRAVAQDFQASE